MEDGADRDTTDGFSAAVFARHRGHAALADWFDRSEGWSPLHHIEVLTAARTVSLLSGGASIDARAGTPPCSPLERARQQPGQRGGAAHHGRGVALVARDAQPLPSSVTCAMTGARSGARADRLPARVVAALPDGGALADRLLGASAGGRWQRTGLRGDARGGSPKL